MELLYNLIALIAYITSFVLSYSTFALLLGCEYACGLPRFLFMTLRAFCNVLGSLTRSIAAYILDCLLWILARCTLICMLGVSSSPGQLATMVPDAKKIPDCHSGPWVIHDSCFGHPSLQPFILVSSVLALVVTFAGGTLYSAITSPFGLSVYFAVAARRKPNPPERIPNKPDFASNTSNTPTNKDQAQAGPIPTPNNEADPGVATGESSLPPLTDTSGFSSLDGSSAVVTPARDGGNIILDHGPSNGRSPAITRPAEILEKRPYDASLVVFGVGTNAIKATAVRAHTSELATAEVDPALVPLPESDSGLEATLPSQSSVSTFTTAGTSLTPQSSLPSFATTETSGGEMHERERDIKPSGTSLSPNYRDAVDLTVPIENIPASPTASPMDTEIEGNTVRTSGSSSSAAAEVSDIGNGMDDKIGAERIVLPSGSSTSFSLFRLGAFLQGIKKTLDASKGVKTDGWSGERVRFKRSDKTGCLLKSGFRTMLGSIAEMDEGGNDTQGETTRQPSDPTSSSVLSNPKVLPDDRSLDASRKRILRAKVIAALKASARNYKSIHNDDTPSVSGSNHARMEELDRLWVMFRRMQTPGLCW